MLYPLEFQAQEGEESCSVVVRGLGAEPYGLLSCATNHIY